MQRGGRHANGREGDDVRRPSARSARQHARAVLAVFVMSALIGACTSPSPTRPVPSVPEQPTATATGRAATAAPSNPRAPSSTPGTGAWRDPTAPVEERVAALLAEMTVDETIGQMTLIEKDSIDPAGVAQALVGGVLSGGGGTPPSNTPDGWYEIVGAYQDAALSTRLGTR